MQEKINKILEMVQKKKNGTIEFTEESKELIHEVAKECRKLSLYHDNKDKEAEYKKGLTAEQVFMDMCFKICEAPTDFHAIAAAKMLLPVIDDKLKEGEECSRRTDMDYKEAIYLLHPDTTKRAIWEIADKEKALEKIEKACMLACEAMKRVQEQEGEKNGK